MNIGSAVHWVLFKTDGPELFNQHKKTVNQFLGGLKFVETVNAPPDGAYKKPVEKPKLPQRKSQE